MVDEKLYIRPGFSTRDPAPKSAFVEAWVEVLGYDKWKAQEEFDEAVAHGEIREYRADDREQGQYVRDVPPIGCVCPPTSEKTCGNPVCPRRAPALTVHDTVLWTIYHDMQGIAQNGR